MKILSYKFLTLIQLISLILATPALAQDATAAAGDSGDDIIRDSMQDLSIVVGLGAGGAILGLSTLSFVDKPADHLNNILAGASLGIIAGVAVVAYKQATKSNSSYRAAVHPQFSTDERVSWHQTNFEAHRNIVSAPLGMAYSFNF